MRVEGEQLGRKFTPLKVGGAINIQGGSAVQFLTVLHTLEPRGRFHRQ